MEKSVNLIYCAGANPRADTLAYELGWQLGLRSDKTPTRGLPLSFVDCNYKKMEGPGAFETYLRRVAALKPLMASVPDLSSREFSLADVERALDQASKLSQYAETVLLIPKLAEQIAFIPQSYVIGFSIPTSYGGAKFKPGANLAGRNIHLLGGEPHHQLFYARYLTGVGAQVESADCNVHGRLAREQLKYWLARPYKKRCRNCGTWFEWATHGQHIRDEWLHPFQASCHNILKAWTEVFNSSNP